MAAASSLLLTMEPPPLSRGGVKTTLKAKSREKAVASTSRPAVATTTTTVRKAQPAALAAQPATSNPAPNPLHSPSYLLGPLRTLRASHDPVTAVNISDTDLAEAYTLLAVRVEACASDLATELEADAITGTGEAFPALLAAQASVLPNTLCAVLCRDVRRAFAPPPSDSDGTLNTAQKVSAYNSARVCRAALRFLADVFRLLVLQRALFKLYELALLAKYTAEVCLAPELSLPGSHSIYSLALGVFAAARVPPTALRRFASDVIKGPETHAAIPGANDGSESAARETNGADNWEWTRRAEALRAAANLLRRYPDLFLATDDAPHMLVQVLLNLVCNHEGYRGLACQALVAFADAVRAAEGDPAVQEVRKECAEIIVRFLEKEDRKARLRLQAAKSPSTSAYKFVFADYAPAPSSTTTTPGEKEEGQVDIDTMHANALVLAGAVAVLAGPRLFEAAAALRTVVKCVERAGQVTHTANASVDTNTKSTGSRRMRALLRAGAWRCLVSAWAQLGSALWSQQEEEWEKEDRRVRAWRVVRQERRGDLGVALVVALLGLDSADQKSGEEGGEVKEEGRAWRVREAARLVRELAGREEGKARAAARALVAALLVPNNPASGDPLFSSSERASLAPTWLLDGTLLRLRGNALASHISSDSMSKVNLRAIVRRLEEAEVGVQGVWPDLVATFVAIVDVGGAGRVEDDILAIWKALLSAGSEINEVRIRAEDDDATIFEEADDTESRGKSCKPTDLICDALITLLRTPSPPFASPGAGALKVVKRLWECVRAISPLSTPQRAQEWQEAVMRPVLSALLKAHAHEPARPAVAALARSLAAADMRGALEVALTCLGGRREALRTLWCDWAQQAETGSEAEAGGAVQVLAFAARNAVLLDDGEGEEKVWMQWEALLDARLEQAGAKGADLLEDLGRSLSEASPVLDVRGLALLGTSVCAILERVNSRAAYESVPGSVLGAASTCLANAYTLVSDDPALPTSTETGLRVFKMLSDPLLALVNRMTDGETLVTVMKHLEGGFEPWFADSESMVRDEVYNDQVMPVYVSLLSTLQRFPSSIPSLFSTLPGLVTAPCARVHIPPPALGPVALKALIEHPEVVEQLDKAASERAWKASAEVRDCLGALGTAWGWKGGKIPVWADSASESGSPDAHGSDERVGASQDSDEVVPASVEDVSSPDPFGLFLSSEPGAIVLPSPMRSDPAKIEKGKEKAREGDLNSDADGDSEQEDALDTPKARPRVVASVTGEDEDADVPVLPLAASPELSVVGVGVRGRAAEPAKEETRAQRGASAELEADRARKRRRVRERRTPSAVRIGKGADRAQVFDGVELSPMRDGERGRYYSVRVSSGPGEENEDYAKWEMRVEPGDVRSLVNEGRRRIEHPLQPSPIFVERSQTAPAALPTASSSHSHSSANPSLAPASPSSPLRRTRTAPLTLAALEELHAAVDDDADLLLQTQDLARAQTYIYEIQGIVQMGIQKKLAEKARGRSEGAKAYEA